MDTNESTYAKKAENLVMQSISEGHLLALATNAKTRARRSTQVIMSQGYNAETGRQLGRFTATKPISVPHTGVQLVQVTSDSSIAIRKA